MNKMKTVRRQKHFGDDYKNNRQILQSVDEVTSDLVEKLKEVSLNSDHIEVFSKDLDFRISKKFEFSPDTGVSKNLDLKKTQKQPRLKKTGVRKSKKKNSFIISDSSSITDDDGVVLYHRVLSENIRADIEKTTPRRPIKQKITHDDDGIFTPYIICRRSDTSYSDSSDRENEPPTHIEKNYSKTDSPLKKKLPTNWQRTYKSSNPDSDSDSFKSTKSALSPISNSPISISPKKKLSWSFSDVETTSESDKDDKKNKQSTPVNAPRRKNSISSTPITFRLKNLKKLTPTPQRLKTPDEQEESWLFLRSLSNCTGSLRMHPQAEQYKKKFKKLKQELAEKLFSLFNEHIFDSKLPSDTKIEWSGRMRSTSGFCYNKRIKTVIGPNNECPRSSRIVLSTKVNETTERLRDTLIHEMCHAAAWIIDNKADGHGSCWKAWVSKVHRKFPELPPIKRCHDYSINTKFKYRCVNCAYTIGRHSKSLNLDRKRCGYCFGKFELLLNNELKGDPVGNSPRNVKAKPLSKFALFVKENYGKIKSENASLKHGEIMKVLSKNFAETKISNGN